MATSPPGGTEIVLAPADAGRLCRDAGLQHLLTPAWQDCLAGVALFYGVDRSTITRAVGEVRPLLAARGFAVPGERGLRLRTLSDVFAYAASQGVHLRIDGTEVQVRRPLANRPGRRAFVSRKGMGPPDGGASGGSIAWGD